MEKACFKQAFFVKCYRGSVVTPRNDGSDKICHFMTLGDSLLRLLETRRLNCDLFPFPIQ